MLEKNLSVVSKYTNLIIIIGVFLILTLLRVINLGYSEYIPDETTVMYPIKHSQIDINFLTHQRKGPMQFLFAEVPKLIGIDVYDEFSYRFLFFIANILGLYFFYKFIHNIEGQFVAVVATLFLGLNGMFVAFGRVVQYQSLNILFSFASLYIFSKLGIKGKNYRNVLLGSIFLSLSILSHWDAVFIIPVVIMLIVRYMFNIDIPRVERRRVLWIAIIPVLCFLAPYMLFYYRNGLSEASNISYFSSRIGIIPFSLEILIEKFSGYVDKFQLYNPFIYIYAIGALAFAGIIGSKRSYPYFYWFIFTLIIFIVFISNAGTHVYNLFYPVAILAALGAKYFYQLFGGFASKGVVLVLIVLFSFLTYQDFLLFADVKTDYPFSQENILGYETRAYNSKTLPNNIIGFPIRRGWREINDFLIGENTLNGNVLPYITNEESSISGFYVDLEYGKAKEYYAIGVKRPLSFVSDYTFPSIKNKRTVKWVEIGGEKTVRIYKVTVDEN